MKLVLLLFIISCSSTIIQVTNANVDCTIYADDLDIVNRNPFYVRLNLNDSFTSVYVEYSSNNIRVFNIFNDVNPSTSIYCLKSLERLQLINTNLPILPDIKNFQSLQSLIIRYDNGAIGQHLPPEFGKLKYLSTLELSDIKNLEDLPNDIEYLVGVSSLTLQNIPNLSRIPDESIGKLTQLMTLNLTDLPNLSTIPTTINNFQQLNKFEITKTSITTLDLKGLRSLYDLKITFNSLLETIAITNMSLSSIDVRNNDELLTFNIQNLYYIRTLNVLSNKKLSSVNIANVSCYSDIIPSIVDNPQLNTIKLKNVSGLTTLEINSLSSLKLISFDTLESLFNVSIRFNPQLQTITFINTPSMKYLDLSGCNLATFSESILKLESLINLVLTSNQLSTLPSTLITDLPNLKVLNLANNNFQGNIFQPALFNIRELYLSNNSLTSIYGIQEYKSLQRLELDYNNILLIPSEIINLSTKLQNLTINYNKLSYIPYEMTNMRSLSSFSATNNRITNDERWNLYRLFSQSPIHFEF
ncbi:unnamed protein product [Rotaria sp. Silwood1]|nr:unnamed protein product [Rotaria sp. Silwood1]CAF4936633.1 unnamed protein product [Rotaria sp. Silwood1]